MTLPPLTLVLGGQRSGKSAYAEGLIGDTPAVYVATAQALDNDMKERIAAHQQRRGESWSVVQEPLDLAGALARIDCLVLIDSLGMWLANVLASGKDVALETSALTKVLKNHTYPVVIVSDHAGQGVIPDNAQARAWLDALGAAHQAIAEMADSVVLVTAGLPQKLK